jgi:hypothetical protein
MPWMPFRIRRRGVFMTTVKVMPGSAIACEEMIILA